MMLGLLDAPIAGVTVLGLDRFPMNDLAVLAKDG